MKDKKLKIRELRKKGFTIREIQKKLNISSPSVVHHHLKPNSRDKLEYCLEFFGDRLVKSFQSLVVKSPNADYLLGVKHAKDHFITITKEMVESEMNFIDK